MKTETIVGRTAFAALVIALAALTAPTQQNKNAGGLHLNIPVETPTSVQFSWTGGAEDASYSLYRRRLGEAVWERIAMHLYGVSGTTFVEGFTLDRDWEYKIQAETEEDFNQ